MSTYLESHAQRISQYGRVRRNGGQPSGVVVVHTAENTPDTVGPDTGAENVARFITTRSDYGSYHDLVDSDSIIRMVPYISEAWHDTGTNNHSYGVSGATKAALWGSLTPVYRDAMTRNMARAAADYAKWLKRVKGITIPARRINRAQSRAKVPGFLGHGESDPGRRSDPGSSFNWDLFLATYADLMGQSSPVTGPNKPNVPSTGRLDEDGFAGPLTVMGIQRSAGTTADGVISKPSDFVKWLQNWLNAKGFRDYDGRRLVVDGYGFESNVKGAVARTRTSYAFQKYLETTKTGRARGYKADGTWGYPSDGIKVIQAEVNSGRLFK
jgi:hypothetical protein